MVMEGFSKPGGKTVKVEVVSRFGFAFSGRDRYAGDQFECDEYTGRTLVNQGRVRIVESPEPVVESPPAEPGAGETAGTGETEPEKNDPEKPEEPKQRSRRGAHE
jgi:hypothetical protein